MHNFQGEKIQKLLGWAEHLPAELDAEVLGRRTHRVERPSELRGKQVFLDVTISRLEDRSALVLGLRVEEVEQKVRLARDHALYALVNIVGDQACAERSDRGLHLAQPAGHDAEDKHVRRDDHEPIPPIARVLAKISAQPKAALLFPGIPTCR